MKPSDSQNGSLSASGSSPTTVVSVVAISGRNRRVIASWIASPGRLAGTPRTVGGVDQQDRVVDGHTDQGDEPDGHEEAQWVVRDGQDAEHPEEAERDRQEDQQRLGQRTELHGDHHQHEQQRHQAGDAERGEVVLVVGFEPEVEAERIGGNSAGFEFTRRVPILEVVLRGVQVARDLVAVVLGAHLDVAVAIGAGDHPVGRHDRIEDGDGVASHLEFESTQLVADLDGQRLARSGGAVVDGDLRGERELEHGGSVLRGGHGDTSSLDTGDPGLDLLDELRCGGTVADRAEVDERLGEPLVASQVLRPFEIVAQDVEHDGIDLVGDLLRFLDRGSGRELGVHRDGDGVLACGEDREPERAGDRTADHHHRDGERGESTADGPALRAVARWIGRQAAGTCGEAPLDPRHRVANGALVDEEPLERSRG